MCVAKAVSDAAAGGQVLITGEVATALTAAAFSTADHNSAVVLYHMGMHQLAVVKPEHVDKAGRCKLDPRLKAPSFIKLRY